MAEEYADATTPLLPPSEHNINSYQSDPITRRRRRCLGFVTIEPALLLYLLFKTGLGPVLEQYIYLRISQDMNVTLTNDTASGCHIQENSTDYTKQQHVQSETSLWMIYCTLCSIIPALVSTVFIGGYTDHGGRKTGLMSPVIGGILLLYSLLCIQIFHLPMWSFLIASLLDGLSGGTAMFLMAAFSYISDITNHRQRTLRIIVLEVVIGFSSTISYIVSGYLIQIIGFLTTTLVLHMTVVLNLFAVFMLPETIPASEGAKFLTCKHFKSSFKVYMQSDEFGHRRLSLLTSILILFFVGTARLGTESVQILFMLDSPLCWNSALIGYFKGYYYLMCSVGGIMLTKLAQPRCGDLQLIIVGCVFAVIHLIYWSFVQTNLMMFIVPVLGVFSGVTIGMLRAFTSKIVMPDELGAMFSWIASMEQIGTIIGGVCFNAIYRATVVWFHGFTFIVIAIFYFCGGTVAVMLLIRLKCRNDH